MEKWCKRTEKTGKRPSLIDCDNCTKEFDFPYPHCCLDECNEHEYCRNCDKGVNKTN